MNTTDTEVQVEQSKRTKRGSKEPGRFVVVFHNDNVTPMEFVIQLLETVYHYEETRAHELTARVHNEGRAAVGLYTLEVAEQKAGETVALARNNGYPLAVTVESE